MNISPSDSIGSHHTGGGARPQQRTADQIAVARPDGSVVSVPGQPSTQPRSLVQPRAVIREPGGADPQASPALPRMADDAVATYPAGAGAGAVASAVSGADGKDDGRLRIVVCDDHEVYRLGLRAVITAVADMTLVGESPDPGRALMLSYDCHPHVVLVGQSLPGGGALDLIRRLGPHDVGVVVLADSDAEGDLVDALRAGARGYLTRRAAPHRLLDGIRAVARKETALDSSVAGHLLQYLNESRDGAGGSPLDEVAEVDTLTTRQRAVASLVAEGLSNAEIARRLYLSQATVKSHLTIILRRLNLRDRTQLAILVNRSTMLGSP